MKILFIYKYCILGGVTTQLSNRLEGFKDNIDCHFAFLEDYGGKVAFKDYPYVYILKNEAELNNLIRKYRYDIISVIDTNEVYKWIKNADYNGFVINEVHTTTENLKNINELKKEKPMDIIITPSEYMKNTIENKYSFKDIVPVEILPNCLELNKFSYEPSKFIKIENKIPILWVGKLDNHKRFLDFLKVCYKLETNYNMYDFQYVIVGGITAKETKIDEFIDIIIDYGILSKVTWYSSISYEDMYKIYSLIKQHKGVYVSTTINESFGMSILEAMAIGLPVVVPNVGALTELPYDNNYSLYPFGNLDYACELIKEQIGKNYKYQIENYSINGIYRKFNEIISKYAK